jgi:hypothetical protein
VVFSGPKGKRVEDNTKEGISPFVQAMIASFDKSSEDVRIFFSSYVAQKMKDIGQFPSSETFGILPPHLSLQAPTKSQKTESLVSSPKEQSTEKIKKVSKKVGKASLQSAHVSLSGWVNPSRVQVMVRWVRRVLRVS